MNVHDGVVADEGGGDGCHEAGELPHDLADDRRFVAGRRRVARAIHRKQGLEDLCRPVVAWVQGRPADVVVGLLGERRLGDGQCSQGQEGGREQSHGSLTVGAVRLSQRDANDGLSPCRATVPVGRLLPRPPRG